jgi:hypothetical protein
MKKEAMDPVGKADADIDNDGDVDKSDKYLHARRKAIGKALRKEEVELDELKKSTLGSYIKRAAGERGHAGIEAGASASGSKDQKDAMSTMKKRLKGIKMASDRLAKESVEELDELKKSTLGSYVNRAADDISHIQRDITSSGTQSPDYKNLSRMRKNRKAGIARAVTSLTKEEAELDEARKSDSYQFTHKPGDAESEKKLADLKQSVKGTGKRVVLQGRLGKDNPNAHKYSKDAPWGKYKDGKRVNSDVSGKSGGHSHQRIQKADAAHHDVYVYNRNESVELDELKRSTLASYVKKAAGVGDRNSLPNAMRDQMTAANMGDKEWYKDSQRKANMRGMGIQRATDRLAKEEVEELDELKKSTLASYIKKATPSAMDQGVKGMDFKNENRPKHFNKAMRRMTGIQKAADKLAKEEVENLDELKKSTLGSYVKKASTNQIGNTAAVLANKNDSETDRARKRMGNRMSGIAKATDRLTKEEVEQIDEAFKVGAMKLKDGSSVTLTRESVDALNGLFSQLNSANKSKMEERMMSGKKGFQEILSFAENV